MSTAEPSWLNESRARAEAAYARLGLPKTNDEAWHYTSVAPWARALTGAAALSAPQQAAPQGSAAALPTAPDLSRALAIDGPRAVFVDGRFAPALSSIEGAPITPIAAALASDPRALEPALASVALDPAHGLAALNAARFTDGALIRIPRKAVADRPLVLVFAATAPTTHVRNKIELEADARADVVELHVGGPASTTTSVTDIVLGPGSELRYTRVHDEPDDAVHVGRVELRHHEDSRFLGTALVLDGKLQRVEVVAHLAERAECRLDGFALARADHVADLYTLAVHGSHRGTSRQIYKAIAADQATTTFYGKVQVAAGTAGNDARQSSKNLLLSAGATANTRPQLEIDAEDVQCSHGATVGRLDEQQVFYLRSRGISESAARALLIDAFAGEVLENIPTAAVREALATRVGEKIVKVARP